MSPFDDFDRTDESFSAFAEPRYAYLNRCGRPDAERVRALLLQWYEEYPDVHRIELAKRFRSTKRWNHDSAVFELLLNSMLIRLGFLVEVHPVVTSATGRRPDFHVSGHGSFILEAMLLTGVSQAQHNAEAARNKLYDDLNRLVKATDFCLNVHFHGTPSQAPSARQIAHFLHMRLEALDPVIVAEHYLSRLYRWRYDVEPGCWIEFHPIPLKPDRSNREHHKPLGAFSESGWCEDVPRIVEGIKDKVGCYGDIGEPYIVAVNDFGFPDNDEIESAVSKLWQSDSAREVSAVAYFSQAHAHHLAHAWMRLYFNPRAWFPIRMLVDTPTVNLGKFFGLPPDWPGTP